MRYILNRFILLKGSGDLACLSREQSPDKVGRRSRRLNLAAAGLILGILTLSSAFHTDRSCDYVTTSLVISADKVLNIQLPDGHFLSGFVRDAAGFPILGARVGAVDEEGFGSKVGLTDESGAFRISVRPGTYRIGAWPPYSTKTDPAKFPRQVPATVGPINVTDDAEVGDISLPDGYVVSGQVAASSGKVGALFGVVVALKPGKKGSQVAGYAAFDGTVERGTRYAMALPKGKYTQVFTGTQAFTVPRPGEWGAWNLMTAASFVTSNLPVGKDLVRNIVLPVGSKLSGSVRDKAGHPLHGVLYISKKGSDPAKDAQATLSAVTNGKFIANLVPGTYDVVYVPTMDTSYSGKATQTRTQLTIAGAAATLNVTAQDGVVLSGKVKDAAGKIAKFGSVALYPVDDSGAGGDLVPQIAKVDKKGAYRLCVPPGEYDLQAGRGGGSGALGLMYPDLPGVPEYTDESLPLFRLLSSLIDQLWRVVTAL